MDRPHTKDTAPTTDATPAQSAIEIDIAGEPASKPSIRERLDDVLNKPREKLELEDDHEVESEKEIDREIDRDRSLSH